MGKSTNRIKVGYRREQSNASWDNVPLHLREKRVLSEYGEYPLIISDSPKFDDLESTIVSLVLSNSTFLVTKETTRKNQYVLRKELIIKDCDIEASRVCQLFKPTPKYSSWLIEHSPERTIYHNPNFKTKFEKMLS